MKTIIAIITLCLCSVAEARTVRVTVYRAPVAVIQPAPVMVMQAAPVYVKTAPDVEVRESTVAVRRHAWQTWGERRHARKAEEYLRKADKHAGRS